MSTEIKCTCPSGDGSLRWPCPAHQPSLARTVDAMFSVQPFEASDIVFGHPRELFRLTPAGDVVVSEGVSTTDAALAFWDAVAQLRPAPTELDRARETPRRQSAVELLLSLGYVWRTDRWEAPQPAVAPGLNQQAWDAYQQERRNG
ncbi:hypothetical protein JH314_08105 [Xanthomonas campestris]|uniref:hypothetical protein n=1 Tax=Xanthomonas campestris TaxID=339 RepID=UPI0011C01E8D|nr:hypothetical protein [Xanthomonas campestris]MCF8809626.1 hypothetical protein [Xanthomonas campestris pv. campestris]MEA9569597.1 hypothetical protein [Xanthomonas campestris]MEA9627422.1 hypothetical protein [Xanthomonas campestris]MEA9630893.1 hypothetical protein [Xanthomonas campestris]MEB1099647.1 hypothetical protein [Xanthomonas campestris pv. campestris]